MTKSAISHQLGYLRQNNLVNYRREGKVVFYSLADGHIKTVFETGRAHINE
jgi:ArsR family transcriptional regulator